MVTEVVLGRNDSFLVRSGDVLFRISDWGDAIMGGARGYIVVEEVRLGNDLRLPTRLSADGFYGFEDKDNQRISGNSIIIGLEEEG